MKLTASIHSSAAFGKRLQHYEGSRIQKSARDGMDHRARAGRRQPERYVGARLSTGLVLLVRSWVFSRSMPSTRALRSFRVPAVYLDSAFCGFLRSAVS
jgi:hypothetical protein